MSQIITNVQNAYTGFFSQIADAKIAAERIYAGEENQKDAAQIISLACKILGSIGLAVAGVQVYHTLANRSISIKRCLVGGIALFLGHDFLKVGTNFHTHFVEKTPCVEQVVAKEIKRQGSQMLNKAKKRKNQEGIGAAMSEVLNSAGTLMRRTVEGLSQEAEQNDVLIQGIVNLALEDTYCLQPMYHLVDSDC